MKNTIIPKNLLFPPSLLPIISLLPSKIFQNPHNPRQRQQKAEDTGNCAQVDTRDTPFRVSNRSHLLPLPLPPSLSSSIPRQSAQVLLARNAWSFCRAAQSKAASPLLPSRVLQFRPSPSPFPPPLPSTLPPLLSKSLYLSRYFPNSDVPSGSFSSAFAVTTTIFLFLPPEEARGAVVDPATGTPGGGVGGEGTQLPLGAREGLKCPPIGPPMLGRKQSLGESIRPHDLAS